MNSCNLCHHEFKVSELLQSDQDEYFCKECFKYEYCTITTKKKKFPTAIKQNQGDSKPRKVFTLDELLEFKQKRLEKEHTWHSKFERTGRCGPIQCPHVGCNRYVSIYELKRHFQHEHTKVPITETRLDTRNPFNMNPKYIRHGLTQCLMLLLIPEMGVDSKTSFKIDYNLCLAVLASRIAASNSKIDKESNEQTALSNIDNDKMILWVSSNARSNYKYTIAVSMLSGDIRIKYYGPLYQLGDSPQKLCREGRGLILDRYHFEGMSDKENKPIRLDVIIHKDDANQ